MDRIFYRGLVLTKYGFPVIEKRSAKLYAYDSVGNAYALLWSIDKEFNERNVILVKLTP